MLTVSEKKLTGLAKTGTISTPIQPSQSQIPESRHYYVLKLTEKHVWVWDFPSD